MYLFMYFFFHLDQSCCWCCCYVHARVMCDCVHLVCVIIMLLQFCVMSVDDGVVIAVGGDGVDNDDIMLLQLLLLLLCVCVCMYVQ